jgi:hypothetical protein
LRGVARPFFRVSRAPAAPAGSSRRAGQPAGGAAPNPGSRQEIVMTMRTAHLVVALALGATAAGCATFGGANIGELRSNPARFHDRTVAVEGVVTTSWGVPLVPFRLYKVDDGTGELTVLSRGDRSPTRGARVRVRGRVDDVGVFNGQSIGLHLVEHSLDVKR